MKKLLAFALAAVMMLTMGFAIAEEKTPVVYDDNLTLNMAYPEGYDVKTVNQDIYLMIMLTKEDAADMLVLVCPDDEYADLERLNDMEEADQKAYVLSLMEDYNNAQVTWLKTEHGTDVILLNESDAAMDFAEMVTLYHGYVIDVAITPASVDNEVVTDDDIAIAMKFLSDMDFVSTAK